MPARIFNKLTSVDIFTIFNIFIFLAMLYFVYYERFINYFGQARKAEFFIYAVLTVIIICSVSMQFRNIKCPVWLFIMIEAGLLFHFAGGIVHYDSKRLYDHYFFYIRYDKFVHFYNAFTAAVCISFIFSYMKLKLGTLRNIIIFFTVLGLGAMIEIFEYAVAKNITDNGVGLYNNNMQDLISNAAGISFFLIISAVSGKFKLNSLHTAVHEK